jgi:hypothetical protein
LPECSPWRFAVETKAVWAAALLVFALSAFHLGSHDDQSSWYVELVAHQSSLPLALAILLQDFRFAFADLFLKRALSLMMLALVAFGLYVWIAVPLLAWHETHDRNDVQAAVTVLALWIATALVYPKLHAAAEWLVDNVILRRTDFDAVRETIARAVEKEDQPARVLDIAATELAQAFGAEHSGWRELRAGDPLRAAVETGPGRALIFVPTVESPNYEIELENLTGGRNLLSGEIQMLESVALTAGRRIDSLRVTHERCEVELREQEFSKLATEARLSALRAQINPHFLFNALTTIGYLIKIAPDRAFETLMHLTKLLRGVLGSVSEFSTLGDEIRLIENYLDIESARFEERLRVRIDVPDELRSQRIPSLILQPIVENAIKHAVSDNRNGGDVGISVTSAGSNGTALLRLRVSDSGLGRPPRGYDRPGGVGIRIVRQRLEAYYGKDAHLTIKSENGGTVAEISIPVAGGRNGKS